MRIYELVDDVLNDFEPRELAEYIYVNNPEYALDLMTYITQLDVNKYYSEDIDEHGQMIFDFKETNVCV